MGLVGGHVLTAMTQLPLPIKKRPEGPTEKVLEQLPDVDPYHVSYYAVDASQQERDGYEGEPGHPRDGGREVSLSEGRGARGSVAGLYEQGRGGQALGGPVLPLLPSRRQKP